MIKSLSVVCLSALACSAAAVPTELTTNGDFETGDTSGWSSFPSAASTFNASAASAAGGSFGGFLENTSPGSPATIKQANLAAGLLTPGQAVNVSFDARGNLGPGGVVFAEFFSELSGGGTSASEIFGGGPLPLTGAFQTFTFTAVTGADVSGGVTLQINAATAAFAGSTAQVEIDNVSVVADVIPEPASLALLGLGGTALLARRRRIG